MKKHKIEKILIVKPSSLGDVVHALPALEIIKEQYPNAKIDWLVNPLFADVLEFSADIDNIVAFNRKRLGKIISFIPEFFSLLSELKRGKYDLVFDFQGLFRSAFFSRLASRNVIGFKEPREKIASRFYKHKVAVAAEGVHAIERNCQMVCNYLDIDFKVPVVTLAETANFSQEVDDIFRDNGISEADEYMVIVPGARWASKVWPSEFFAKVIQEISGKNNAIKFICVGTSADDISAQKIQELSGEFSEKVYSFTGKTSVGGMIEILRRSKGVITNDSGPMHIAAVLGVPTFALFGATDPAKTGPFGNNTYAYLADIECRKCLKRWCPKVASNDEILPCHGAIDVNSLVSDVLAELSNGK